VRDKIVTIVPLWKFHLDGDVPFRLTRHIAIRKLKRKEKADTELHVGFMLGRTPRFCFEHVHNRGQEFDWGDGKHQAEKAIEAMRLFSAGDVDAFVCVDASTSGISRVGLTTKLID